MCYHTKINKIQTSLLSFVKSRIYSFHDAQDIVQNVNVILVNKESDYDENKNFKAWAFTIASFQIKSYLTILKRYKVSLSPMSEKDSFGELNFSHINCPASAIEEKEKAEKLCKSMVLRKKSLSKNQLNIINLYSEGMSQKEISKILNMKLGTVSATKSRAIERMKALV
jgi:RNA polymerase sigma factor (sigma-70 family)